MVHQYYDLCMIPGGSPLRVPVSQYDQGSRTLHFRLYGAAAGDFQIPEGAAVTCEGTKPDGKSFAYPAERQDGAVTVALTQQMTAVAGTVACQIVVTAEGGVIGSGGFSLEVAPAAVEEGADYSKTELDSIGAMTRQAVASAQEVKALSDQLAGRMDAAQARMETAAQQAESSLKATAATAAGEAKTAADSATAAAKTAQDAAAAAKTAETSLSAATTQAAGQTTALNDASAQAQDRAAQLSSAAANADKSLSALQSANLDAAAILEGVDGVKEFTGYVNLDVLGLEVDYTPGNITYTRLGGAVGRNPGADFDQFPMFGGRRRCMVGDDGKIAAWYGEEGFAEDGSQGQVMVYQPKFYYKMVPLELEPVESGMGYHILKAQYYISALPRDGFRLHPAFYDANGAETEYFLEGAYCGSLYDVSEKTYNLTDQRGSLVYGETGDKLSSISGAQPATGKNQSFTLGGAELTARNRGSGWHVQGIKQIAADQMLMLIEMGTLAGQDVIGKGYTSGDAPHVTGGTSALGAQSGMAPGTDGQTQISWRGKEDAWGNVCMVAQGIQVWGNGKMLGGEPHICKDLAYSVNNKRGGNYEGMGLVLPESDGMLVWFGYGRPEFDWIFIPSRVQRGQEYEKSGVWVWNKKGGRLNEYNSVDFAGGYDLGKQCGPFFIDSGYTIYHYSERNGARLMCIPDGASDIHRDNQISWRKQTKL